MTEHRCFTCGRKMEGYKVMAHYTKVKLYFDSIECAVIFSHSDKQMKKELDIPIEDGLED